MKPIPDTNRRVANIHDAKFEPFITNGNHDGDVLQLATDRPLGKGFYVYRMAPGTTTIPHQHKGAEEFLVLEGDAVDHDGFEYGPGDLVWLADGTEHCTTTKNGCLIAVYEVPPEK